MRFEGDRLLLIIARQDVPFVVLDAEGKLERRFELPKTALPFIAAGGYFGVGNHRRIRYLKPIEDESQRDVFGSRQDFEHSPSTLPGALKSQHGPAARSGMAATACASPERGSRRSADDPRARQQDGD